MHYTNLRGFSPKIRLVQLYLSRWIYRTFGAGELAFANENSTAGQRCPSQDFKG